MHELVSTIQRLPRDDQLLFLIECEHVARAMKKAGVRDALRVEVTRVSKLPDRPKQAPLAKRPMSERVLVGLDCMNRPIFKNRIVTP